VATRLALLRNGAVGFIGWLDGLFKSRIEPEVYTVTQGEPLYLFDNVIRRIRKIICMGVTPENAAIVWQLQESLLQTREPDDPMPYIVFDACIEFF
jgi:hypothetical protein